MRRVTPRLLRKALDAAEVVEFIPSTHAETLRDLMDRGRFTRTGWVAPTGGVSDEGWLHVGTTLLAIEQATPWCWADWWLLRGSRTLPADWDGPNQRTLDNRAIVARAYVITRRRVNVSLAHHAELTSLPEAEQDELLDWCTAPQRPSVSELRAEKHRRAAAKLPPCIEPTEAEPTPPAVLKIEPPAFVTPPSKPPAEPPPEDVALRVELFLQEALHAWATETAAGEDVSLADWIISLIERAKDTD
jgi:hypothetical protein